MKDSARLPVAMTIKTPGLPIIRITEAFPTSLRSQEKFIKRGDIFASAKATRAAPSPRKPWICPHRTPSDYGCVDGILPVRTRNSTLMLTARQSCHNPYPSVPGTHPTRNTVTILSQLPPPTALLPLGTAAHISGFSLTL